MRVRGPLLLAALAVAAALSAPPAAAVDFRLFLPRSVDSGAFIDLLGLRETDDRTTIAGNQVWTDTYFREKLTLFSNGYFYHPRFLVYQTSVTAGLKQEQFEASYLPPLDRREGDSFEYDLRLLFLPEHPYNLELYARRFEPLFREQFTTRAASIETTSGIFFQYRDKPWFFHARLENDRRENERTWTEIDSLDLNGRYFERYPSGNELSFSAMFSPSRWETSSGSTGETTEASIGNAVDRRWSRLDSRLSVGEWKQEEQAVGATTSRQYSWYESGTLYLPGNLRTELHSLFQRSDISIRGRGDQTVTEYENRGSDVELRLIHKLYESLESTYAVRRDERTSASGRSEALSHNLLFAYDKKIPRGLLLASVGAGRSESKTKGVVSVVEEGHPGTRVPGAFQLNRADVDRRTLIVFLKSPVAPYEMLTLTEGVHYVVAQLVDRLEITLFALPPEFVVPGTYEIRVTYSLDAGEFELRSDTLTYSVSLELFDQRVTPYFGQSRVDTEVLEGYYPGAGLDLTSTTAGLLLRWKGFQARAEYQDYDWDVSPYESWRYELQYTAPVSPTTSVYASATYMTRSYGVPLEAASGPVTEEEYTSGSASLTQQLFRRRLLLSLSGTWAQMRGRTRTDSSSFNASLMWKVGVLDLSAGATVYQSETTGQGLFDNSRTHEYYYLRATRRLF